MKKDKEWLKEALDKLTTDFYGRELSRYEMGRLDGYTHASMLFDELDEPEKPVIPQFVADFIRATKPSNSLRLAFEYIAQRKIDNYDDELALWVEEGNSELFASAWLDGYEAEKEPHYYVAFEGEFNLLYVTHVDIYGEDGKFNYSSVFDKKHALKFTDKSKAEYLADFLGAIVVEVTE